jgi:hypothetical protein
LVFVADEPAVSVPFKTLMLAPPTAVTPSVVVTFPEIVPAAESDTFAVAGLPTDTIIPV